MIFDELDKQCANYFSAKTTSLKAKQDIWKQFLAVYKDDPLLPGRPFSDNYASENGVHMIYRVMAEVWQVLADAYSALAYSCVLLFHTAVTSGNNSITTSKMQFLFDSQHEVTLSLHKKMEEEWKNASQFPIVDAKEVVRDLKKRLRGYILSMQSEVVFPSNRSSVVAKPAQISSPSRSSANITGIINGNTSQHNKPKMFGDAFGSSQQVYHPCSLKNV